MFLSIALSSMRVWRDNPRRVLGDITDLTTSVQRWRDRRGSFER